MTENLTEEEQKVIEVIKTLIKDYGEEISAHVGQVIKTHCNSYNNGIEKLAEIVAKLQRETEKLECRIHELEQKTMYLEGKKDYIEENYARNEHVRGLRDELHYYQNTLNERVEAQLQKEGFILGKIPEEVEMPLF